jgi:glycosyltransferase involved in cell wall biosynthesis
MNPAAPDVSVVIAAYQSDSVLRECLRALRAQTFRDFEVIVVNSSPEDRTREIVVNDFPEVNFLESPTRLLPHAARNRGVRAARGRLLVFTDADCRGNPDWLERLVEVQAAGHQVVCGSIEPVGSSWFERGVHLCKYSFRLSALPPGPCSVAGTANACYARRVWNEVGPFDGDRISADGLLSWRAARRGWDPWFEPRAVVRHAFTHTAMELWRERLERGADFAAARVEFYHWSPGRLVAYLIALPMLPMVQLARGARDAFRCGWGRIFLATAALQLFGHVGWSLGEARIHWALIKQTIVRH